MSFGQDVEGVYLTDSLSCNLTGCDGLFFAVNAVEDLGVTFGLAFISVVLVPWLLFAFFLYSALHSKEVNFDCINLIFLLFS